ncbi:MAG: ABC transporter permease [Clostridiales bacterium]|nr:ABC transporter permease [Clostridiales bacterium]
MTKRRKNRQDHLANLAGQTSPALEVWRRFRKNPVSMTALVVLVALIVAAILAGFVFDYATQITGINAQERLQFPSASHWFGTDAYGRDVFMRVLYGARYSLFIGIVTSAVSMVFGILIGASCAYFGGIYDAVVMRIVDAVVCIPSMLLMLALVAVVGKGMRGIIIALVVTSIPGFSRIIRSIVQNVVNQEYIEAAHACGTGDAEIIWRHILPNCFAPILVDVLMNVASCIMAASSLSYLGMGIQVPAPEWGAMLSDATSMMRAYPYLAIFPGIAIVVTSLSFNLIGDGLTDALDPKNS